MGGEDVLEFAVQKKKKVSARDARTVLYGDTQEHSWCFSRLIRCAFPRGWTKEGCALLQIGLPIFLTNLCQFLLLSESIMLCGHLTTAELDGVSLANSIINALGISIGTGLCTACDTFFSQSFGSKNKRRMGMYLQRSLLIVSLFPLLIWSLHINIEPILVGLGQMPDVSAIAARYMLYFTPGILFHYQYLILARYMQNQDCVLPPLCIGIVGNIFNVVSQYICLYKLNVGYEYSAICQAGSFLLMWLLELTYIFASKLYKETWDGWKREALFDWWDYLQLALPGIGMVSMETICFEIGTFISGYLGKTELGAQSILFQCETIAFQIAFGLSVACNIRVGQNLGAFLPNEARATYHCGILFILITATFTAILFATLRSQLPWAFTNDQTVADMAANIFPLMGLFQYADGVGAVSSGTLRGCGRQNLGALLIFVGYYVFGLPAGICLALLTSLGIFGIWLGFFIGLCINVPSYFFILCRQNWELHAQLAQERIKEKFMDDIVQHEDQHTETTPLLAPHTKSVLHHRTASNPVRCSLTKAPMKAHYAITQTEFRYVLMKRLLTILVIVAIFGSAVAIRMLIFSL